MILVTGATGHIGNVLVRELLARGQTVRALLLADEDASSLDGLPVEKVEGNVLDLASLQAAFKGVSLVFHLAGIVSIMPGRSERVRRVNVEGTLNVLRAARDEGVQRLVYTSSIHAIHRAEDGVIDESVPFDPAGAISEYDRSKAEASLAVIEEAGRGLDAVLICPTGVVGPFDYRRSDMGELIWNMVTAKVVLLVNGAYDFVDVRDVANGLIQAAERGRCGEAYILSGHRVGLFQLLNMVKKIGGVRPVGVRVPSFLAHLAAPLAPWFARQIRQKPLFTTYSLATVESNSVISSAKARRELGYQTRSMLETLVDTIRWRREQTAR